MMVGLLRLACVASVAADAHAEANADCLRLPEEEVSMLQARVDRQLSKDDSLASQKHMPRQRQSSVHEQTKTMVETVRQLAKHMSGDVLSILQQLREEVERMITVLEDEADTDRFFVNSQFQEIEACLEAHPVAGRPDAVESLCDHCSSCEDDRVGREEHRARVCADWNVFASGLWNQMVGSCQHNPSFREEPKTGEGCHAGSCSNEGSEEIHEIAQAMQFWETNRETMQAKRSACTEACESSTCISCDDHRREFEEAYCSFHQHCGMLETCYRHEIALYDAAIARCHVAETPGLHTLQQESYLMHRQILCIVDLIQAEYPTNSTISDENLETCSPDILRGLEDVSNKLDDLDIPVSPAPSLPDCSPPSCQGSCPAATTPQCFRAEEALGEAQTATFNNGIINSGFTLSSSGSKIAGRLAWNMPTAEAPPTYANLASVEDESPQNIVVHHAGLYNVVLQILPVSGTQLYPYIEVNGNPVMYGYGGSSNGYSSVNMDVLLQLEANSRISVGFQSSGTRVYTNSINGVYHNLIISQLH